MIRKLATSVLIVLATASTAYAGNLTEDLFRGCIGDQVRASIASTHHVDKSLVATMSGVKCLNEWSDMTQTFGTARANEVFNDVLKKKGKVEHFANHGDE